MSIISVKKTFLIVNFGGPRTTDEIESFLKELLCDQEVVRTGWPQFLHELLFKRVAKKRAKKVIEDYNLIGGGSPIFADTEYIAEELRKKGHKVLTFHRYLPDTHEESLLAIHKFMKDSQDLLTVFPLFPQFTYATTGSIAKLFCSIFSKTHLNRFKWIKSYSTTPQFIDYYERHIKDYLQKLAWKDEEVLLAFSAHGIPIKFIESGDPYQRECEEGFHKIMNAFPLIKGHLCYQSQFGKEEWIKPYTKVSCEEIDSIAQGRKKILFVPLSFTSDHVETLFEVEYQYMPILKNKGYEAARLPAFNRNSQWIDLIEIIATELESVHNCMLVRCGGKKCC